MNWRNVLHRTSLILGLISLVLKKNKMPKRFRMSRRTFLKVSAVGVVGGAVVLLGGGYLLRDRYLKDRNPSSTATDVIRGQRLPIPILLTGTEMEATWQGHSPRPGGSRSQYND